MGEFLPGVAQSRGTGAGGKVKGGVSCTPCWSGMLPAWDTLALVPLAPPKCGGCSWLPRTHRDGRWRAQAPTLSPLGQHPRPPCALPGGQVTTWLWHCMCQPCQGTSHCPPHLSRKPLHLQSSFGWEWLHPGAASSSCFLGCREPTATGRKSSSASPRFHHWINGSNARAPHGPSQRERGQCCPQSHCCPYGTHLLGPGTLSDGTQRVWDPGWPRTDCTRCAGRWMPGAPGCIPKAVKLPSALFL